MKFIIDAQLPYQLCVLLREIGCLDSFYFSNIPRQLLIVTTGNIKNKRLLELFSNNMKRIEELFKECNLVELNNIEIIGHE